MENNNKSNSQDNISEEELMEGSTTPKLKLILENTQEYISESEEENEEKIQTPQKPRYVDFDTPPPILDTLEDKTPEETIQTPQKPILVKFDTPPASSSLDDQSEDLNELKETQESEHEIIYNDSDTEEEKEKIQIKQPQHVNKEKETIQISSNSSSPIMMENEEKESNSPKMSPMLEDEPETNEIKMQSEEDVVIAVTATEEEEEEEIELPVQMKSKKLKRSKSSTQDPISSNSELDSNVPKKKPSLSKLYVGIQERSRKNVLNSRTIEKKTAIFSTLNFILTKTSDNQDFIEKIENEGGTVLNIEDIGKNFNEKIVVISSEYRKTLKYLIGLALGIPLLHENWVTQCLEKKRLIFPRNEHILLCGKSIPVVENVNFDPNRSFPKEEMFYSLNLDDIEEEELFLPQPLKSRLFYGKKICFLDDDNDMKALLQITGSTLTSIKNCDFVVVLFPDNISKSDIDESGKYKKMILKHEYIYHCLITNSFLPVYKNWLMNFEQKTPRNSKKKKWTKIPGSNTPKKKSNVPSDEILQMEESSNRAKKLNMSITSESELLETLDEEEFMKRILETIKKDDIEQTILLEKEFLNNHLKEEENIRILQFKQEESKKRSELYKRYQNIISKSVEGQRKKRLKDQTKEIEDLLGTQISGN
jgi:hypothetical protein